MSTQSSSLQVTPFIAIPLAEFELSYVRSSGPGGQNVNKVNSKCVLRWDPARSRGLRSPVRERFFERFALRLTATGELVIMSDRHRDQKRNLEDCLGKLREMLLEVSRPPKVRKESQPTRSSERRRRKDKAVHSDKKASRRQRWDD